MAEGMLPPIIGHLMADVTGWSKGMATVKAETAAATGTAEKAFTGMAGVGKIALFGVGAAAVMVGGVSLKMAGDFESSTNRLVTSAGEIHGNLELVRKGMLQMAGEVGYSANELSKGMYLVESAGFHGADGLKVLRASAEGAKAENADLAVVANAVTSALVDYHLKSSDAAQVTTTLVAAVSQGKTTFAEMTSALHSVLPIASAAHISLADITAALASMTVHGMSADQAAQNMAHAIQHLQTVTAPQAKELAMLGISARQLSDDLGKKGLTGTLQEISEAIQKHMGANGQVVLQVTDALKKMPPEVQKLGMEAAAGTISMGDYAKAAKGLSVEAAGQAAGFATLLKATHGVGQDQKSGAEIMQAYAAALKAATGDSTGLNVALMLTGENAEYTRNAVKAVAGATVEAGNHVKGWADIQATFNQHLDRWQAGTGAMAIELGTKLIPIVIRVGDAIQSLVGWLGKHQDVSIALAGAIGGVLLVAIAAYTIAMVQAAIATIAATWPILLIIVAAAALGAAIALVIMHWDAIRAAILRVAAEISSFVTKHAALAVALMIILGPIGLIIGAAALLITHWNQVSKAAQELASLVVAAITQLVDRAMVLWEQFKQHPVQAIGYVVGAVLLGLAGLLIRFEGWAFSMLGTAANLAPQLALKGLEIAVKFELAILDELRKLPGQMWQIGIDITQGIIDAIKWMIPRGAGAIGEFVQGLLQGAKDASKSKSPSLLFAEEVGLPLAQGVMVGIQRGSAGVQGAINSLVGPPAVSGYSGGGGSGGPVAAVPVVTGPSMDDTNRLLTQIGRLLDERLPRAPQPAAFSTKAYTPGT